MVAEKNLKVLWNKRRNVFQHNVSAKPEFTVKLCFVLSTQSVDITAIYSVLGKTKSCTGCPNKHGN